MAIKRVGSTNRVVQFRLIALCFALIFTGKLTANDIFISVTEQSLGRDFGILVGDIIEHHYIVSVPADFSLSPASLPSKGELNYWLQMVNAQYEQVSVNDTIKQYHLQFTFQTFYAPLDVRLLTIPELSIRFNSGDKVKQLTIPAWQFTMSPLKEITPRGVTVNGEDYPFMRPDLVSELITTERLERNLLILVIIIALGIAILAVLKGYLFNFSRSPFQIAYRQVNRLKKHKQDPLACFYQALQSVHQAFNGSAKQALFAHQIEGFIQQHPEFTAYQQKIHHFYQLSSDAFYADHVDSQNGFEQLLALCHQLAGAERLVLKRR